MAGTLGASAYLDVPAYLRAMTGQETASLVGLNTTLGGSGTIAAGTVTLPVAASAGWAAGPLWILDGPYAEVAQVTGALDGTHLTLAAPGTAFAHAAGVSASQAGASGSLAEALLRASAWIENYCRQGSAAGDRSLYAISRTERWGMPGARAWLDGDDVLAVRPGHFPVQSVAALAVTLPDGTTLSLDVSQAQVVASGRLIELPLTVLGGASPVVPSGPLLSRWRRQWVSVTYSGGITIGAAPYDVQQACVWVTSELLAERRMHGGRRACGRGSSSWRRGCAGIRRAIRFCCSRRRRRWRRIGCGPNPLPRNPCEGRGTAARLGDEEQANETAAGTFEAHLRYLGRYRIN